MLKLFPRPRTVETAFVGLASPRAAIGLLNLVQERTGGAATSFELIKALALELALRHGHGVRDPLATRHPWYVLLQLSSQSAGLRTVMEDVLADRRAARADRRCSDRESLEQAKAFWRIREILPEVQKPEGGSVKHDVSFRSR